MKSTPAATRALAFFTSKLNADESRCLIGMFTKSLFHVALPKLTILQKDNFRHLNSFYRTVDKLLDGFDDSFKNDIDNAKNRQNTLESVYEAAVIQLGSMKESLSGSLNLSSNLRKGDPLPIFSKENA